MINVFKIWKMCYHYELWCKRIRWRDGNEESELWYYYCNTMYCLAMIIEISIMLTARRRVHIKSETVKYNRECTLNSIV